MSFKPTIFDLVLQNSHMLNPRVRHLEFKLLNHPTTFEYTPGQFISLLFEQDGDIVRRNFSIANSPNQENLIEIAVTQVPNGFASTKLHQMPIGSVLKASGPFGIFLLTQQPPANIKRYILVATGTGVTPYRAMLPIIGNMITSYNTEFLLLLGIRNPEETLYLNDFIKFQQQYNNFKLITCYSRDHSFTNNLDLNQPNNSTQQPAYQCSGYVQDKLSQLNLNPLHDLVYLCGNPFMIDHALDTLENHSMPKNKVKREKYISAK